MAFNALYYPSWNPPVRWLRSTLLVFDQIQVILPSEIDDPEYHAENRAIIDLLPEAFDEVRQTSYEAAFDPHNEKLLGKAFDLIARTVRPSAEIKVVIDQGGRVSFPGYAF